MSYLCPKNAKLLNTLSARCVEHLIVGGWAVKHYCPDRVPRDLDLWVNPTEENKRKLQDALETHCMESFGKSLHKKFAQITTNRTKRLHIDLTSIQPCDIFETPREFDFVSMYCKSELGTVGTVSARIVSCCDLIAIKQYSIDQLRANPLKIDTMCKTDQERLKKEIRDVNFLVKACNSTTT